CFFSSGAVVDIWQEFALDAAAWSALAALGAIVVIAWWFLVPASRRETLPMPRRRRPSWKGIDVFTAFVLMVLIPALVHGTLRQAGLFDWLYGEDADKSMRVRTQLWSSSFAAPLVLALILLGLRQVRGTRPAELGLSPDRAAVNCRAGYGVWLVV